jgi:hypothetical protein
VAGLESLGVARDVALRSPWWFSAAAYLLLFFYAAPKLTTEKIETARAAGVAAKEAASESGERSLDLTREAIAETGTPGVVPPEITEE